MAYNVKNIIIGAAAVFISTQDSTNALWPAGAALPTLTAATSSVTTVAGTGVVYLGNDTTNANWRHAGFTTDGIEVAYQPDYGDVAVDQLLDSAKLFKQGMRVMVNTTFAEATLLNLLVVWGQQAATLNDPGGTADAELGFAAGSLGDEPVERALVFVGPAPRNLTGSVKRERLYLARRALSVESSSHSLARADATTVPVSFRLLPDPTYTGKEYGIVRDRNIA